MNWEIFFKKHEKKAYVIAYNYLNNKEDALDAIQDTMISMYKSYSGIESEDEATALFYKILNNKLIDKYRSLKRLWNKIVDTEEDPVIIGNAENITECSLLGKYFKKLSSIQKRVFLLKIIEEMTFKEISIITGASESTCKTHYSRALKKLKDSVN